MAASDRSRTLTGAPAGLPGDGALAPLALAAVASVGTAALVLGHHRLLAGVVALAAAAPLLAGSIAARGSGAPGRLAILVIDRVFDASVLAPLAWTTREAAPRVSALALVCLGASFVASYERARGEALGFRGRETIEYRVARVTLLLLALLTGRVELFLWVFVVVVASAVAVRWWNVQRQVRTG